MAFTGPTGGTGPIPATITPAYVNSQVQLFSQDLQVQDFIAHLQNATPDQIRAFVQNNVTTLPDVIRLLTMLTLMIARQPTW